MEPKSTELVKINRFSFLFSAVMNLKNKAIRRHQWLPDMLSHIRQSKKNEEWEEEQQIKEGTKKKNGRTEERKNGKRKSCKMSRKRSWEKREHGPGREKNTLPHHRRSMSWNSKPSWRTAQFCSNLAVCSSYNHYFCLHKHLNKNRPIRLSKATFI